MLRLQYLHFSGSHLRRYFRLIRINHALSQQVKSDRLSRDFIFVLSNLVKEELLNKICILLRIYINESLGHKLRKIKFLLFRSSHYLFWYHHVAQTFNSCTITTMSRVLLLTHLLHHIDRPIEPSLFPLVNFFQQPIYWGFKTRLDLNWRFQKIVQRSVLAKPIVL